MNMVYIFTGFLVAITECLTRIDLRSVFVWLFCWFGAGGVVCLLVSQFVTNRDGMEVGAGVGWSSGIFCQETERDRCCSAYLLFLFSSGPQSRADAVHIEVGHPHLSLPENNTLADTPRHLPHWVDKQC